MKTLPRSFLTYALRICRSCLLSVQPLKGVPFDNTKNTTPTVPTQMKMRGRGRLARATGVPQAPTAPLGPTTEADFRGPITIFIELLAAQSGNQSSQTLSSNSQEPTTSTRFRDFLRKNPLVFIRLKVEEDP